MHIQNEQRMTENEQLLLEAVYRQTKITDFVRLNFVLPKLAMSDNEAAAALAQLEEQEMVKLEKYGILRLTEKGRAYLHSVKKSATLFMGE